MPIWACSQENESRSEKRFGTWFGSFLIWEPDFTLCECKASFKSDFWNTFWNAKKRVFWIVIRVESLILGHVNAKVFRNMIRACAFWKCTLKPCMGQSARTAQWEQNFTSQCAVGTKYYLAVRRFLTVIGKAFAMHVTHVVQITIPITKWIAIRNIFRNVIRSFVNTACVAVTEVGLWLGSKSKRRRKRERSKKTPPPKNKRRKNYEDGTLLSSLDKKTTTKRSGNW